MSYWLDATRGRRVGGNVIVGDRRRGALRINRAALRAALQGAAAVRRTGGRSRSPPPAKRQRRQGEGEIGRADGAVPSTSR